MLFLFVLQFHDITFTKSNLFVPPLLDKIYKLVQHYNRYIYIIFGTCKKILHGHSQFDISLIYIQRVYCIYFQFCNM